MFAKKLISLSLATGALVLTGCGHSDPLVVPKYSPMELDQGLLTKVEEPSPPPRKKFLTTSVSGQRDMLFIFSLQLQTAVQQCNASLESIDSVYQKHLKRVDEMNKASEK